MSKSVFVCLLVLFFWFFVSRQINFNSQVNHKIYQQIVVQPDIMIVAHQCTHEGWQDVCIRETGTNLGLNLINAGS